MGKNPLRKFIIAGDQRLIATHFGTYDYTASCSITAKYQEMDHPVCDFAHHMTKVALAHTGVWLSDGATNTMPIGPHRGANLTDNQLKENENVVHNAWYKGLSARSSFALERILSRLGFESGSATDAIRCCFCFLFGKL